MATDALETYAQLTAALAALPPPREGTIRVYRGQTEDYPNLTPSGLRNPVRKSAIWHAYSNHLYRSLFQRADEQLETADLEAFGLWFHAVAQHYGPGSDFLDVTTSIEVALWFALNKASVVSGNGIIGPPGPPNPARDHVSTLEFVDYDPWTEVGYIYVMDLPKWSGESVAEPGTVVDLADAPALFSSSLRMRAQSGCLVYCRNEDGTALDVRGLLVEGTPIPVRRPMSGTGGLQRSVPDMFPSPATDEWFARFSCIPMGYAPLPSPPTLQRSIPVTLYMAREDPEYMRQVRFTDVVVQPPLVHRELDGSPGKEPLAIILESPFIFPYPPAQSVHWNHGLLWNELPKECPEYAFGEESPRGQVALDDVLFEFSLLEEVGWDRVVRHDAPWQSVRGVRLKRRSLWSALKSWVRADLDVQLILQGSEGGMRGVGPMPIRFNSKSGRIEVVPTKRGVGAFPLTDLGPRAKPIMVSLMIWQFLSASLKCSPTPVMMLGMGDKGMEIVLPFARGPARLYRVSPPAPHRDWFVLRDAGNPEEPFTHLRRADGELRLRSKVPFIDMNADRIARAMAGSPRD